MSKSQVQQLEDQEHANEMVKKETAKIGHSFQFVVWKKALDVRYIFNAVVAFGLA